MKDKSRIGLIWFVGFIGFIFAFTFWVYGFFLLVNKNLLGFLALIPFTLGYSIMRISNKYLNTNTREEKDK